MLMKLDHRGVAFDGAVVADLLLHQQRPHGTLQRNFRNL